MKRLVTDGLLTIITACLLLTTSATMATELVWEFVNPSFGGSPFNGDWLLASAQAQNKHVEKAASQAGTASLLQDFENRLNSQILYRLSNKIIEEAFGEESLLPPGEDEASYTVGSFDVQITSDISGITVSLTDLTTGNSTTVQVPYF